MNARQPLDVECPICAAPSDLPCFVKGACGSYLSRAPHIERSLLARGVALPTPTNMSERREAAKPWIEKHQPGGMKWA